MTVAINKIALIFLGQVWSGPDSPPVMAKEWLFSKSLPVPHQSQEYHTEWADH